MDWPGRMNLAIEYIEAHLDRDILIDDVAKLACCSKFHFHRMFYACFGVTFSEHVRRRKLTLAASDIQRGDERIVDIAMKYGYSSPNAFTRAFRKLHGINPGKIRSSQVRLIAYHSASFTSKNEDFTKMDYRIVEIPSFKVVGKSKQFQFDEFIKQGSKFWRDYVSSEEYKQLARLANGKPGTVTDAPLMSVYFPNEKNITSEFIDLFGLEVTAGMDTERFEVHNVPEATYAEFDCTYKTSMQTNRYIYGDWFTATGYERDDNKPDVAAYFPIAFRPHGEMGIRWWVPVKKKK